MAETSPVPLLPPMPDQPTFDYWQHEYWRLGQMYRELVQWQFELERWEQDLATRSRPTRHHRGRRGGGPRGREQEQQE